MWEATMTVMSAAEAGPAPGTGQEVLPRGPRMAPSAADGDGIGPEASSDDEPAAKAGQATPEQPDRRLRLVSTEVHVTEVRVAREVSTRIVRTGAPGADPEGPRVSVPPPAGPRVQVRPPGRPTMAQRSVRAERASVQRASVQRVVVPGARVQRVRRQRASCQRVSVRQTAAVQPGKLRLTRRGRRV